MSNPHITGQVTRFEADRGFAIVATEEGDIFVHTKAAAGKWQHFADHATVKLEHTTEYNSRAKNDDDRYRMVATRVISVEPAEEFEVLTKVAYFDPAKGVGRVVVGDSFSRDSAFLPARACEAAGMGRPGPGMPIRAIVVEGWKGPVVTSFEWGREIEKEYAAKNAPESIEVELKFFNRRKSFGFISLEDGTEVHFHISGVEKVLTDRFYHDKGFSQGARFKAIIGEFKDRPTAKILELISVAPEKTAEVGKDEQSEPTEAVDVLMAEHAKETMRDLGQLPAVEANAEAAAEEAPKPKRTRAKKPAEAKGVAPKAEAKPKNGKVNGVKGGDIPMAASYGLNPADQPIEAEASSLPDGPLAEQLRGLSLGALATPAGNA